MLSLRKRIFLLIGSVALVVVLILLWIFFGKKAPTTPPVDIVSGTPTEIEIDPITSVEYRRPDTIPTQPESSPANPDETYAKQTARIFVERFWSYSNQNDNQHIDDALALSVDSMHTWIVSQAREQSLQYSGVTTEVLSSRILSYTTLATTVEIGARQTILSSGSAGASETKNITAKVDLVKVGEKWLVEGIWLDE